MDEAYEFLDGLGLLGVTKGEGGKNAALNASALNGLVQSGKMKRGARASTTYGTSRGKHVSLSVVGNGHPSKIIAMERQLQGTHTAACKERFLVCLDHAAPRHAPVAYAPLQDAWTWLPLTSHQAFVFSWQKYLNNPSCAKRELQPQASQASAAEDGFIGPAEGYLISFPDGVESRIRYVARAPGGGEEDVRTEFRISSRWNLADPTDGFDYKGYLYLFGVLLMSGSYYLGVYMRGPRLEYTAKWRS